METWNNKENCVRNLQTLSKYEYLVGIPFKDRLPLSAQRALHLFLGKKPSCNDLKKIAFRILRKIPIVEKICILTGFPCHGFFETDGPIGSLILANYLTRFKKEISIIAERPLVLILQQIYSQVFGDSSAVQFTPLDTIKSFTDSLMFSVEYPGSNDDGYCHSMSGFHLAAINTNLEKIIVQNSPAYWVAIGDGGNEIGLGEYQVIIDQFFFQKNNLLKCGCKGGIGVLTKANDIILGITSNFATIGLILEMVNIQQSTIGDEWKFDWKSFHLILQLLNANGIFDGITNTTDSVDALSSIILEELYQKLSERFTNTN